MDRVSRNVEQCLTAVAEIRCITVCVHADAVGTLSGTLGRAMGLESGYVARLQFAAGLHDIGKAALPENILNKSGPLDAAEWATMREHSNLGFAILSRCDNARIRVAALVALYHHERWDGSGYPDGLGGEEIPPEARIVGVCDVYHALREVRPYKSPLEHEQALSIILDGDESGRTRPSHFDPLVHAAFKVHSDLIRDAFQTHAAVGDASQESRPGVLRSSA